MNETQWEYIAWASRARLLASMQDLIEEAKSMRLAELLRAIGKYKQHKNNKAAADMLMPF